LFCARQPRSSSSCSGYAAAALVCGAKALRRGQRPRRWRRSFNPCWTLNVAHISLFVIYTAQVSSTAQRFENSAVHRGNAGRLVASTSRALAILQRAAAGAPGRSS